MNFTPKNIFKGTNSDGSKFIVEEWHYGDIGSFEPTGLLSFAFGAAVMMAISPSILLLISIFYYNGRVLLTNIIGAIIGAYFLFDVYHHWIGSLFSSLFLSEEHLQVVICINYGVLACNIAMIAVSGLFGDTIKKTWMFLLAIVFLLAFFKGQNDVKNEVIKNGPFEYVGFDENGVQRMDDSNNY